MKTLTTSAVLLSAGILLCTAAAANITVPATAPHIQLSIQGNVLSDHTIIAFSASATNQFDAGYDSLKYYPTTATMAPAICSVINPFDLCINTLHNLPMWANIPIRVKVGITGKYIISADSILGMPAGSCIFLEDLAAGTTTDLQASPSGAYIISDTTVAPRFVLHISQPLSISAFAPACSYTHNGRAILSGGGSWTSMWQNAAGDTLVMHNVSAGSDTLPGLTAGVYMVQAIGGTSCANVADTFTVNAAIPVSVNAVVTDATCKGSSGSIDAGNVSGGEAPYTYHWSNGATNATPQHLLPGVYTLFVSDAKGCTDTSSYMVHQLSALHAGFSISADTILPNQACVFTNKSNDETSQLWDFGDNSLISESSNISHIYISPGTYTVMLVGYNAACSDTARQVITVLNATAVQAYGDHQEVSIWCAEDGARIKFDLQTGKPASIQVYTPEGQLVSSRDIMAHSQAETVPLGNAAGIYLVQVNVSGASFVKKIIKSSTL